VGFAATGEDRREFLWIGVTNSLTAEWIARQITEAFSWSQHRDYVIRDRDHVFGSIVRQRLRAMGHSRQTYRAPPWQNGFAERLIGSIRRECLDHPIVYSEAHLRRVARLREEETRTHRSLH
jgi:hypothetical protein